MKELEKKIYKHLKDRNWHNLRPGDLAKSIMIEGAERFGLAQLHQLRGRVGRSHHRAYAYFIVPPKALMTADAIKRLDAIELLKDNPKIVKKFAGKVPIWINGWQKI